MHCAKSDPKIAHYHGVNFIFKNKLTILVLSAYFLLLFSLSFRNVSYRRMNVTVSLN